jgi:hypothetical protein
MRQLGPPFSVPGMVTGPTVTAPRREVRDCMRGSHPPSERGPAPMPVRLSVVGTRVSLAPLEGGAAPGVEGLVVVSGVAGVDGDCANAALHAAAAQTKINLFMDMLL